MVATHVPPYVLRILRDVGENSTKEAVASTRTGSSRCQYITKLELLFAFMSSRLLLWSSSTYARSSRTAGSSASRAMQTSAAPWSVPGATYWDSATT